MTPRAAARTRARDVLLALAVAACGTDTRGGESGSAAADAAAAGGAQPLPGDTAAGAAGGGADDAVRRHFAAVPASERVRAGACPFECCMYGEWRATTPIRVRREASSDAPVAFTLQPGDAFLAADGEVRIVGAAIVVVLDTVPNLYRERHPFAVGDTLVLLDYLGEGYWNVWHDGRLVPEVSQFWADDASPGGRLIGDYLAEWWVHVRAPRDGWFLADRDVAFDGADGCAD